MQVVILSRGRSRSISTHKLLPGAVLVVPKGERKKYEYTGLSIRTIPDKIVGLGPVRNWVLDHFKENIIVMADDDIDTLYCMTGKLIRRIEDPEIVYQVICQAAHCALDLGTSVFGFNQAWDVRKYREPFSFSGWAGGVIGVTGRELRFMEQQKFRVDVDYFLQALLKDRVIWKDERFSFSQAREKNLGGNSIYRTSEALEAEIRKLKNKWGKYFSYRQTKSGENTQVKVKRRQVKNA